MGISIYVGGREVKAKIRLNTTKRLVNPHTVFTDAYVTTYPFLIENLPKSGKSFFIPQVD